MLRSLLVALLIIVPVFLLVWAAYDLPLYLARRKKR